jgi:hypothetical protein
MQREVYGKNGDKVVVLDVRDLSHGEYSVDVLLNNGGYETVYSSVSLEKCIKRAKELEAQAVWSAYGTPIPNDCLDISK